eukprot:m.32335 g.32335  ORF g.32335 m.32335 type:complete len:526 (+) comp8399_c0_seq1:139-1716(+)
MFARRIRCTIGIWDAPQKKCSIVKLSTQNTMATSTPLVSKDHHFNKFYINGQWVSPSSRGTMLDVVDPGTGHVVAQVPDGSSRDVDAAVNAAAAAFPGWSGLPVSERKKYIEAMCDEIEECDDELASVIAAELGMPLHLSRLIQVGVPLRFARSMCELVDQVKWEEFVPNEAGGGTLVLREPYGVVSCITPWNYPLNQIATKVFPALIAGCTVVVKPSEVAPLDANVLAEIFDKINLPPGVFNLVHGTGVNVGEPMCTHEKVDMVSFTGSTRAGKRVAQLAAAGVKKCKLELGGKSAHIVLDDADLKRVLPKSFVSGLVVNSGQTCAALTRLLIPRNKQEEAVAILKHTAKNIKIGPQDAPGVMMGPIVSKKQLDIVRSYIKAGVDEGATLVTGGVEPPKGLESSGYFVQPTIFKDVDPKMKIAQEEIFGPVLCVIPYDNEDDAVRIANDSIYGLSGAVSSGSDKRATQVARKIRTGDISVNGAKYNINAPFGGYKQSGIGREKGTIGIEEFLLVKALNIPKSAL